MKDLSTGASLVRGRNKGNVYEWPTSSTTSTTKPHVFLANKPTMKSWHCCFGHPSSQVLTKLFYTQALPVSAPRIFSFHCDSCLSNKSHKLPFGTSSISCTKPLEIIYIDVWGPAPIISYDHYRYYVIFVDYFTKYT